ncbi:MAG: NAD(P)-dependent alcohol dehydrogenase [Balneolales bacterium]
MKAYIHTKYGPPGALQFTDVPDPVPAAHEILIQVCATTVNRTDDGFLRAKPFIARFFTGLLKPKNPILGSEYAGRVKAAGDEVTLFKPGDHVFGFSEFGAHAEYITVREDGAVAAMPNSMPFEQAAPLTEGAHYALNYIRKATIRAGQDVLIYGATGAIGSAALQIIKAIGARVTAVCDTANTELVKSLGADEVIDYTRQDFTKTDKTFDLVLDAVGKSSFKQCRPLLRKGGIYSSTDLGYLAQNPFLAIFTPMFGGKKVLFPIPSMNREIVHHLKNLAVTGKFRPVIDRQYGFEQLPEAFQYVNTGQKTGNVLITFNFENRTGESL